MGKQDKKGNSNSFNLGGNNKNRSGKDKTSSGRERNVAHTKSEEHSVKNKQGGHHNNGRLR